MALKTKTVTIAAEGRDLGKVFLLTEMPAIRVESWAARLLKGMSRSGVDIDDAAVEGGIMSVVAMGAKSIMSLDWAEAEPLLAEMLACAQIVPDPTRPAVTRPLMVDTDIEEVRTLLTLRSEIVELHVGFSIAAALSNLGAAAKGRASDTPTSHSSSVPLSEPDSPRSTS